MRMTIILKIGDNMNEEDIYYKMVVPLKKFYVIDCAVNYLIDLDMWQRYISEPYINPILEDLYDIYADEEATVDEMMFGYVDDLIDKMENAEDDMMRITTEDYNFLTYIHRLLKNFDLDFAYFLANLYLTVGQHEAIINHHHRFDE